MSFPCAYWHTANPILQLNSMEHKNPDVSIHLHTLTLIASLHRTTSNGPLCSLQSRLLYRDFTTDTTRSFLTEEKQIVSLN